MDTVYKKVTIATTDGILVPGQGEPVNVYGLVISSLATNIIDFNEETSDLELAKFYVLANQPLVIPVSYERSGAPVVLFATAQTGLLWTTSAATTATILALVG